MKKKRIIVILMLLSITTNVQAITSNDVTYDNNGTTENLTESLDTLYNELKKYKTGGSVEANQMLAGVSGYSKGELVTGTIPSKGATTYTPGTTNQTITSGQYLSGTQTIAGDSDLKAGNIKSGVNLFGVNGTYTSDANARASDILSGKTAYVNGSKITGTHEARHHVPNLIHWDIWNVVTPEAQTWDWSYVLPDNTAITVMLAASREGEALNPNTWITNVYLDGVKMSRAFQFKTDGTTWEGIRSWIFSGKKGQTLRVTATLPGGIQDQSRTMINYVFGSQDQVDNTGFDTTW